MSVSVLFFTSDFAQVSASTSARGVSSESLGRPVVSSLLGVHTASTLGVSSLLFVIVGSARESRDAMSVAILLTGRWRASCLYSQSANLKHLPFIDKNNK